MLVAGKLRIPVPPRHLVARPRIEGLVAGLIERHQILLVNATPGSGKTTAVSQATLTVDRAVAWLTLSDSEVAAGRLIDYLAAAIATHVPAADGIARSSMAAGIPHDEVAALIAEAVGDQRLLLVVDEAERIADAPGAMAVLEGLVRYAPPAMRLVFISRRELPLDTAALQLEGRAGIIDEADLAFTLDEVSEALRVLGAEGIDPESALRSTGGWVAGIMFEAWRAERRGSDEQAALDPLHGFLARNILEQLTDEERELLLVTSVLQAVTVPRAESLGIADAGSRLTALRRRHLPASWRAQPLWMRCHPRFREYLLERFTQEGGHRVPRAWCALGHQYVTEGYAEEAVEAFLTGGDLETGAEVADTCIVSIVERLDFDVARRWLDAFAPPGAPARAGFVTAELLIGVWTDDVRAGERIGDRLTAGGELTALIRSSPLLAALLAFQYSALGRHADARAVLDAADPSPETAAARYAMTARDDAPVAEPIAPPALTGGPIDIGILRANYHRGLLERVIEEPPLAREAATEPWRVLAMLARGQTSAALERYERAKNSAAMWMPGAELMIELGRPEEARDLIEFGRATGAGLDPALLHRASILEAKLALRCGRDTAAARRALARVLGDPLASNLAFLREHAEVWLGLALLIDGEDEQAASVLRPTVTTMTECGRRLMLPAAAVYLSEAEWRAGNESDSDRAADAALAAAEFQGANHILLTALADFPAVAWRRVEAEPAADSPWHRFARLLRSSQGPSRIDIAPATAQRVEVIEFGEAGLLVDGRVTRPRLTKAHTLLALLAAQAGRETTRRSAIAELFESGSESSTVSYLRLAVKSARETLPADIELALDRHVIRCAPPESLSSESVRFETLLAYAHRLTAADRLQTLSTGLALHAKGPYLERETAPWVHARRRHLDELAEEALIEASDTAYELGEYEEAERLARAELAVNRFRESGWRQLMRAAAATRDRDAVLAVFRECESAVAEIGATPSAPTKALLAQLRG
jgi:ATP/maltotriose-dependent transcriptional regulator MalT/DNA-binding SARP family transcriptional activator